MSIPEDARPGPLPQTRVILAEVGRERVHPVSVGKVLGALEFLASFGRSVKIESRDGETTLVIDYPEGETLTVTDTSLAACIGLIQEHGTKESKP